MRLKKRLKVKTPRKQPPVFNTLTRIFLSLFISLCTACLIFFAEHQTIPAPPAIGEKPHLYSNQLGDNFQKGLIQAIGSAKKSIHLMMYSLKDEAMIHALNQSASKGIKIKVICDHKASLHIENKLLPSISLVKRFGPGLMHLKILVIDEEISWIGSCNFTKDSFRMNSNLLGVFPSPPLAQFIIKKSELLQAFERPALLPYQPFNLNGQITELWFLPDNKKASDKVLALIDAAKKTLRVAMYTWTREDFAKACIAAKQRGLKVEIALDRSQAKGAGEKITKLFKKAQVPLYFNEGKGLLHHKFAHIDDEILIQGSANWTKSAFSLNDDCFTVTLDLTEEQNLCLKKTFEIIKKESQDSFNKN